MKMHVRSYLPVMLGTVAAVAACALPGYAAQTSDAATIAQFLSIAFAHAQNRFVDLRGEADSKHKQTFAAQSWPDRTNLDRCKIYVSAKSYDVYECDSTQRKSAGISDVIPLFNALDADVKANLPAGCSSIGRQENAGASAIYSEVWSCSGSPKTTVILDVEPVFKNGFANGEEEDQSKLHYSIKMGVQP